MMGNAERHPEDASAYGARAPINGIAPDAQGIIPVLTEAMSHGRMFLVWQPVVQADNPDRAVFFEGLIRLYDPRRGLIPAADFMPVVETLDLGREIDCLALQLALQTLRIYPDICLSVNLSARRIGDRRWMHILTSDLRQNPGSCGRLILEITESTAMPQAGRMIAFMAELRQLGIRFALDDFGAGFTAFCQLRQFQFDILKIDAQFIHAIDRDRDNQALVSALLSVVRHFDLVCVAEGVETVDESRWLAALGVDLLQGYCHGPPSLQPVFDDCSAIIAASFGGSAECRR
jgi:EAL domain-containing protein (putative c-di-GMP-specific phosphodiesterase class I)